MCQKGSEGRGALLMEIQRRERVILVTPAHGGQVFFLFSLLFLELIYDMWRQQDTSCEANIPNDHGSQPFSNAHARSFCNLCFWPKLSKLSTPMGGKDWEIMRENVAEIKMRQTEKVQSAQSLKSETLPNCREMRHRVVPSPYIIMIIKPPQSSSSMILVILTV